MRDAYAVFADAGDNFAANFARQLFGSENPGELVREKLDEQRGDVRGGVGDRSGKSSLLADLIECRERAVTADQKLPVLLFSAFDAAHEHGCGEARILQNSQTD